MNDTQTFRILVVEDNVITAKHIAATLRNFGWEVTDICNNASDALASISARRPDLALLDINLDREIDGIQIGSILKLDHQLPFVFLTSYSDQETLNRILNVNPYGYVQKPFNPLELKKVISQALGKVAEQSRSDRAKVAIPAGESPLEGYLFVRNNRKIEKIAINSISLIESSGRYTYLYFENKKKISNASLKDLLARLEDHHFIQVHKSYLVNLAFVESIAASSLTVDGKEVPVGKQYRDGLIGRLDII